MKYNVGTVDRTVRMIAGVAAMIVGLYLKSWWGVIGIVLVFTAAAGWCPAYLPFKISTRKKS